MYTENFHWLFFCMLSIQKICHRQLLLNTLVSIEAVVADSQAYNYFLLNIFSF